jgi:hypothetical protein
MKQRAREMASAFWLSKRSTGELANILDEDTQR